MSSTVWFLARTSRLSLCWWRISWSPYVPLRIPIQTPRHQGAQSCRPTFLIVIDLLTHCRCWHLRGDSHPTRRFVSPCLIFTRGLWVFLLPPVEFDADTYFGPLSVEPCLERCHDVSRPFLTFWDLPRGAEWARMVLILAAW